MLTLNQVIKRIQTIANNHAQINFYQHGDIVDVLQKDIPYVAVITDLNTITIDPIARLTTFNFRFWFSDLADVSEDSKDNEIDVQSDLISIAEDFIALMRDPSLNEEWIIDVASNGTLLREQFSDIVLAWMFDINIKTRYNSNRCQVPLK